MKDEIRVVAFLKLKSHAKKAIEAAVRTCAAASHKEEGCLMYAGHWDQSEERLVFVEHWASQAALDEHMKTPHFHAFVDAIADLVETPPDIITLHEIK